MQREEGFFLLRPNVHIAQGKRRLKAPPEVSSNKEKVELWLKCVDDSQALPVTLWPSCNTVHARVRRSQLSRKLEPALTISIYCLEFQIKTFKQLLFKECKHPLYPQAPKYMLKIAILIHIDFTRSINFIRSKF